VASTQHALRTWRASLRSTKRLRTQFANSPKYKYKVPKVQVSKIQVFYGQVHTSRKCYSPTSRQARVLVVQASVAAYLQDLPSRFFSYNLLNSRKWSIHTDKLRTRATFTCPQPRIPFFGSRVVVFTSNPSCLKYWLLCFLFYKEAMCKGSTGNGLLYAAKAVPSKDYFLHLNLTIAKKGCWVISPNYRASHPRRFCAVGVVVAQRYDILHDWLWDACHMAGVCWRSRCEGFRSEEGPHYCFEQSARKLS
jgi:hypothetical protein